MIGKMILRVVAIVLLSGLTLGACRRTQEPSPTPRPSDTATPAAVATQTPGRTVSPSSTPVAQSPTPELPTDTPAAELPTATPTGLENVPYPAPGLPTPTPTTSSGTPYPGPGTALPTATTSSGTPYPAAGTLLPSPPAATPTIGPATPTLGTPVRVTPSTPLPTLGTPAAMPSAYPGPGSPTPLPGIASPTAGTPGPTAALTPTATPMAVRARIRASDPRDFQIISGQPQLVEFFSYDTPTSRSMAPVVHALEDRYEDRINFVYLDIDDPANSLFKALIRGRIDPFFFLLDSQGVILEQWQGLVPIEEFEAAFANLGE